MKQPLLLLTLLMVSLLVYLGYSERFPYVNAIIYQKAGLDLEAARLYRKGCDEGNMLSCMKLGGMYETDQNLSEAVRIYQNASERGYKPATERLVELNVHP